MRRVVIVGGGMAASRLCGELASAGALGEVQVTVIGEEAHLPYNRALLTPRLGGQYRDVSLSIRTPQWYSHHGIDVWTAAKVSAIDRGGQTVHTSDGRSVPYDALVFATGSKPLPPPPSTPAWVFNLHTIDDCDALADAAQRARSAVVVGGGPLGIEAAAALVPMGLSVTLVEADSHVMAHRIGPKPAGALGDLLIKEGIDLRTDFRVSAVRRRGETCSVEASGDELWADVVVWAAGTRPDTDLAVGAGIATAPSGGGIVVDDLLASVVDSRIYAIGDCAAPVGDSARGISRAWEHARVVGANLFGGNERYKPKPPTLRLRAAKVDLAVVGANVPARAATESGRSAELHNPLSGAYRLATYGPGGITSCVLVGDTSTSGSAMDAMLRRSTPTPLQHLMLGKVSAPGAPVGPVCICNNVTEQDIATAACAVESQGVADLDEVVRHVRQESRAGTGCGGCGDSVVAAVERALGGLVAPAGCDRLAPPGSRSSGLAHTGAAAL